MDNSMKFPALNIRVAQDSRYNPYHYWEYQVKLDDDLDTLKIKYPNGVKDPTFCKIASTFNDDSDEEENNEENS